MENSYNSRTKVTRPFTSNRMAKTEILVLILKLRIKKIFKEKVLIFIASILFLWVRQSGAPQ